MPSREFGAWLFYWFMSGQAAVEAWERMQCWTCALEMGVAYMDWHEIQMY